LPRGTAYLRDHRRRCKWNHAKFQPGFMFGPCPSLVPVGSHENGGVLDPGAHAERRTVRGIRSCARTLRRASSISFAVKRPCCFSQNSIAAKPARRRSASRAAFVIQAETLTLSRAAAARMSSCMSGAIVIASLGDGLPRGIQSIPLKYHTALTRTPRPSRSANRCQHPAIGQPVTFRDQRDSFDECYYLVTL